MLRKTWEEIKERIDTRISAALRTHGETLHNASTCEVCGCLVDARFAVKGEPEIRRRPVLGHYLFLSPLHEICSVGEDYMYTPYYCKVHAPVKDVDA